MDTSNQNQVEINPQIEFIKKQSEIQKSQPIKYEPQAYKYYYPVGSDLEKLKKTETSETEFEIEDDGSIHFCIFLSKYLTLDNMHFAYDETCSNEFIMKERKSTPKKINEKKLAEFENLLKKQNEKLLFVENKVNSLIQKIKELFTGLKNMHLFYQTVINAYRNKPTEYWYYENLNTLLKSKNTFQFNLGDKLKNYIEDIELEYKLDKSDYEFDLYINIFDKDKNENGECHQLANLNKEIDLLCSKTEIENNFQKYSKRPIKFFEPFNSENTEMFVDDEKVPFSYSYKFDKVGEHKVKYKSKCKILTSTRAMFYYCYYLNKINFIKFNSDYLRDMSEMFFRCNTLQEINLNNFNTSNVVYMQNMFGLNEDLKEINLKNFNTKKVKDMNGMFNFCGSLKQLDLSNFSTENVEDMSWFVSECYSLVDLNINNFNTEKVKDMNKMFKGCSSLKKLDLSHFNTVNVRNMMYMFGNCGEIEELNISGFNTEKVQGMRDMFYGLKKLKIFKVNNVIYKKRSVIETELNLRGKTDKIKIQELNKFYVKIVEDNE